MIETAILEIGQIPIADHWDKSLLEITGEPVLQIFEKVGIHAVDSLFVSNMLCGSVEHQLHLGSYLADWVGARYAEAIHIESACASGAAAFRAAVMAVASGEAGSAIAVGSEKMTDVPSEVITSELATAADSEYERDMGVSFVALNAMLMRRYMEVYGWEHKDFAPFSLNAHQNAVHNPYARYQKAITEKEYLNAAPVCNPISVQDAAPVADGAAAVLIVPLAAVRNHKGIVRIIGSAAANDTLALAERKDLLRFKAAERSARKAYAEAGLVPNDIDLFELHDAFSITAALSLEACGFAEAGCAPQLAQNGSIFRDGSIPISTLGGLKARGHPVGATGLYQIADAVNQLRGVGNNAQIKNAKVAMTQALGGLAAVAYTNILAI